MPNSKSKSSSNSKLNGSIDTFANSLRDIIKEAVSKAQENTVGPLEDLIIETREELKKDYDKLSDNMNARFRGHEKTFSEIKTQLSDHGKQLCKLTKEVSEQGEKLSVLDRKVTKQGMQLNKLSDEVRRRK